ncbi:MAG: universal stress protein [Prosthecobacter sp.]|uniref:universal stress protein n=1 Tax=Prosthecobacter sp. TaxID=1965333 RepID=UPI0019E58950|nr:universal stress protein [Prosthecobacter sp.]MBE2282013.1 universal stress protein [Prosthecobacter sp.]
MATSSHPHAWRKLLVPTDFSDSARVALETAVEMQRHSGLEVLLLHVAEPAYQGLRVQTAELHSQMRHEAAEMLKKLAVELFPDAAKVRVLVKDGRPAEVICQTAKEEQVDAIVIPTHGHSGLKHALLGSVTDKVVRQASCHVLIVKD